MSPAVGPDELDVNGAVRQKAELVKPASGGSFIPH
jgi:hypothetical protein